MSIIPDIKLNGEFISLLADATLETTGMSNEHIHNLRNPGEPLPFDPNEAAFQHSLCTFLACSNSLEKAYKDVCDAYLEHHPDEIFYSHSK